MNGIHDMGGMMGFGPVVREADEPVFHADWERRMFALATAVPYAVPFSDDHLRPKIERIPPREYLGRSYYEHWYRAVVALLLERGAITEEELAGGPARPVPEGVRGGPTLSAAGVVAAIEAGATARRDVPAKARFRVGDSVRARNLHPTTHTRLPRYARGRVGRIERDHGVFSFNDSNARGEGERPQHVYSVRFEARELWGADARAGDGLYLDLWDEHLDPA
jgi:nitrile hydratase